MEMGAGFRVCGFVVRRFVTPSGKAAFLTLDVPSEKAGKTKKIDLRAFDDEVIGDVGSLTPGAKVQVTGVVDMEKVTDKARAPIMIDGREKWTPALTIKKVTVEGSSKAPKPPSEPSKKSDGAPVDW